MSIASLQSSGTQTNTQSNFNSSVNVKVAGSVVSNSPAGEPVHDSTFVPCFGHEFLVQHSFAAFGTTQATDSRAEQHVFEFKAKHNDDLLSGLMNAMNGQETIDVKLVTYRRVKGALEVSTTYTIPSALVMKLHHVNSTEEDSYIGVTIAASSYQFDGGQKSANYEIKTA